jgi:hypothetical protein
MKLKVINNLVYLKVINKIKIKKIVNFNKKNSKMLR